MKIWLRTEDASFFFIFLSMRVKIDHEKTGNSPNVLRGVNG